MVTSLPQSYLLAARIHPQGPMPDWLSTWLSWSSLGASGTLGLGLLFTALEEGLQGDGVAGACALWFAGLGFCLVALLILRRSGIRLHL
jgi:hypothetical protein